MSMIYEIYQILEIEEHIEKNTLIAFDLDNTLITTKTYYGSVNWEDDLKDKFKKEGLTYEEALDKVGDMWDLAQDKVELKLIEKESDLLINKWKKTSPIVGLTARPYELKDLTHNFLKSNNIIFSSFDDNDMDDFHEGILYCSSNLKSSFLSQFINKLSTQAKPKQLIIIDDKKHNLEDILSSPLKEDFKIKCFHYINKPTYID